MTTVHIRSVPTKAANLTATPFRLLVPRELDRAHAMKVWTRLSEADNIKTHDPFVLPGVSTVFPGSFFGEGSHESQLADVAHIVEELAKTEWLSEQLADSFVELNVPDAYEDAVEPLAVDDLTQPGQPSV